MSGGLPWSSIYPIKKWDKINTLEVLREDRHLFAITCDLEILGNLSDMPEAGKQVAQDILFMFARDESLDKTIPILMVEKFTPTTEAQSPDPMKFNRDRSFSGVRPCDEEKASAFWNACMDELERLAGVFEMSEWTKWTDRRTPNERIPVRLRCKPKHKSVEGVSLVEWTTKQSLHGMGLADMIFVPDGVSNWDGYNRTVPVDLEWRLLCEGEDPKKENTVWHGLSDKLAPCPFCGSAPHVSANETRGGQGAILSYSPNRYDTFDVRCCLPRISGMNVPALIAKWNARPDAECAIAEAVAEEWG